MTFDRSATSTSNWMPAFQVLLDSGVKLVLAPWEISSKVWLTPADLDTLVKADPSLSLIVDAARDWSEFWHRELKTSGFNPFDTLAIGYAISPAQFQCEHLAGSIRQLPDDTATGTAPAPKKPYLLVEKAAVKSRLVTYCFDAGPKFKSDLMSRLRKGRAPIDVERAVRPGKAGSVLPRRRRTEQAGSVVVSAWLDRARRARSEHRPRGEGNMNYTLRVRTNGRSIILKQARPWVEKYPVIDAPDERAVVKQTSTKRSDAFSESPAACLPCLRRMTMREC